MLDRQGSASGADEEPDDDGAMGIGITEAELTELAMAADVDTPLSDDAVPLAVYLEQAPGLLPQWYMPAPMARRGKGWRVPVVLVLVAAFVIIEAFGLCSTFGQVIPA